MTHLTICIRNAPNSGVAPWRRSAGLSLVELLIAIALGLIIVAAMVAVFANSSVARNEIERMSRQIENGRYAVEILSDDLRHAGFYAQLNFASLPGAGTLLTEPEHDPCSTDATHWLKAMNLHVRGYDPSMPGYDPSHGGVPCLAGRNYKAGTDVLVVRRVRTCAAGAPGCEAAVTDKPYLQVPMCATDSGASPKLELAPNNPATVFTLMAKGTTPANCHPTDLAPIRQYLVHIYFVSKDNASVSPTCPNSDPTIDREVCVPTLKRLELTGTGWAVTPLVEGIEQLNVNYGVDCTAFGAAGYGDPDDYRADPTTATGGTCTSDVNRWMNVMSARVFVLARNLEPSPRYTDPKCYNLGVRSDGPPPVAEEFPDCSTTPPTFPGSDASYRRHAYTALVRINNPAGRRDTP